MLRLGQPSVPSPTPKQLDAERPHNLEGERERERERDVAVFLNGSLLASTGETGKSRR